MRCLAHGHLDTQLGGAGDRTSDLAVTSQPRDVWVKAIVYTHLDGVLPLLVEQFGQVEIHVHRIVISRTRT